MTVPPAAAAAAVAPVAIQVALLTTMIADINIGINKSLRNANGNTRAHLAALESAGGLLQNKDRQVLCHLYLKPMHRKKQSWKKSIRI